MKEKQYLCESCHMLLFYRYGRPSEWKRALVLKLLLIRIFKLRKWKETSIHAPLLQSLKAEDNINNEIGPEYVYNAL